MEGAIGGGRFRSFRIGKHGAGDACHGREVAARQDRRVDAGERFLRNGTSSWFQRLQNKAEMSWPSVQIVDHSRTVACLVGRGAGIDVVHFVTDRVGEQHCDLAGRRGDCLGLADAGRQSSLEGAERGVGASDRYGSKAQKSCGPTGSFED